MLSLTYTSVSCCNIKITLILDNYNFYVTYYLDYYLSNYLQIAPSFKVPDTQYFKTNNSKIKTYNFTLVAKDNYKTIVNNYEVTTQNPVDFDLSPQTSVFLKDDESRLFALKIISFLNMI